MGTQPAAYRPRQVWVVNLAPLVAGARQGAVQAAKTVSRERARARRREQWRSRRWLVATAAGVVVAGAAAGTYAVVSRRRPAGPAVESPGSTPRSGFKSTVESGRTRVADLARTMAHRVRRDGARSDAQAPMTLAAPDHQVVTQP